MQTPTGAPHSTWCMYFSPTAGSPLPPQIIPAPASSQQASHALQGSTGSIYPTHGPTAPTKDVAASLRDSQGTWNQGDLTEQKPVVKGHFGPFLRNALGQPVGQYRKKLPVRSILFCFLNFFVCVCVAGLSSTYLKLSLFLCTT